MNRLAVTARQHLMHKKNMNMTKSKYVVDRVHRFVENHLFLECQVCNQAEDAGQGHGGC